MPRLTITVEKVTPAQAARWLEENNKDNRTLRADRVTRYARDMASGSWDITAAPITFNGDGGLHDGQHRLAACVEAKTPFWTAVARGVDSKARVNIDTGATRTIGDLLRWRKESNANALGATLGVVWKYDNAAFLDPRKTATRHELLDLLDAHPEIKASMTLGSTTGSQVKIPRSVCGGAHYLFSRDATEEEATAFLYLLRTEGAAKRDTGPFVLRRYAIRTYMTKNQRPKQADWMALIIKAFNLWMAGAQVNHLSWRRGGSNAEPFPSIVPQAFIGEEKGEE
jgi:hypothetical protein